jgi:nanoRNase/pAp phosphatase (c-di-AMP/oligoRNAs hydrolase)
MNMINNAGDIHGLNRSTGSGDSREKLYSFRSHILPANSVLIITHDYPDPDCLASAFGVQHLMNFWGVKSSVISFGGFVGRAENRSMIRVLDIHTVPFVLTEVKDYDRIVLVDSFPDKGNVPLTSKVKIHAVIDHHPNQIPADVSFFFDVRENFGATSTIITEYLVEAGCPITPKLATALYYGIKTDTGDMRRENVPQDLECYKLLFDIMDHHLLSRIENPDRDEEFFRILHRAVETAYTSEAFGYTYLGNVTTPDYVAEMADLFHSLERLEWMVSSGLFKSQIFFSIRSKSSDRAGAIAEQVAKRLGGSGGGHSRVAAGRIPVQADSVNKTIGEFEHLMKELFGVIGVPEEKLL